MTKSDRPDREQNSTGYPAGGWLPERNDEQKRAYNAAKPEQKLELNKQLGREQRAECQEDKCANAATHFNPLGIFGWCVRHSPDEDEDS